MKLSILICTLPERYDMLRELRAVLDPQVVEGVEIRVHDAGPAMTTGAKRQQLLQNSSGAYIVFIDDDDMVPDYYVSEMLRVCESGLDCAAINGTYTVDGKNPIKWRISKDFVNPDNVRVFDNYYEGNEQILLRRTNHITAVKRDIALAVGFPDKWNAEDKHYSDRLVLNSEFKIDRPMYEYRYSSKNKSYK